MASINWRRQVFHRDKWRCHYCKCKIHKRDPRCLDFATIDHLTPLARGGMSIDANVVASCRACNEGKGKMTAEEYRKAGMPRRELRKQPA